MTREYFENCLLQKYWPAELDILEALAATGNILLIDGHTFYYESRYLTENDWFSDGNHLTLHGATEFSRALTAPFSGHAMPAGSIIRISAETIHRSDL